MPSRPVTAASNTVIGTYGGWLDCSQCGNCIEVCPTGTLLDGVYRHETRPWELEQTISTDVYSSDGMQLSIGSRGGAVHRIVARDRYVNGLNGEFLDVKARFAHEFINHPDRIKTPMIRYTKGGKLIPATWDAAIQICGGQAQRAWKIRRCDREPAGSRTRVGFHTQEICERCCSKPIILRSRIGTMFSDFRQI